MTSWGVFRVQITDKAPFFVLSPMAILRLLPFGLLLVGLLTALWFGLDRSEPSDRLRFHAIPIAISQLYHGKAHDYTGYASIAHPFQGAGRTQDLIKGAINTAVSPDDKPYYWVADDRGQSDFVYLAFAIFGAGLRSIFMMWFFCLAIAVGAFLLAFHRDRIALTTLNLSVLAVVACIPLYVRAQGLEYAVPSVHISESRLLDVLAAVSIVFFIYSMARFARIEDWKWAVGAAVQALLLAFILHMRSSALWFFVAILLLALGLFLTRLLKRDPRGLLVKPVIVIGIAFGAWGGVQLHHQVFFNKAYFGEIGARTVWHNFLMGLWSRSAIASELKFTGVSDLAAVEAVLAYMKERNDPRLGPEWNTTRILNSLGSHNSFDWKTYEQVAKERVFDLANRHPQAMLKIFLFDKPGQIIDTVVCNAMLICSSRTLRVTAPTARFMPLGLFSVCVLWLLTFLNRKMGLVARPGLSTRSAPANGEACFLLTSLGFMAVLGLGPSWIFYPAITQLGGFFVFGALTFYVTLWLALAKVADNLCAKT